MLKLFRTCFICNGTKTPPARRHALLHCRPSDRVNRRNDAYSRYHGTESVVVDRSKDSITNETRTRAHIQILHIILPTGTSPQFPNLPSIAVSQLEHFH